MSIIRALSVETLKQRLYNPYYLFFFSLNMSTIDAAIIKALVEHIGGNPDSIPEESLDPNVLDYSKLEPLLESDACTWEIDDKGTITPDGSNPYLYLSVQIGDILLIKKKGENEITKSVCIKSGLSDKEGTTETQYYNFQSLTGSSPWHH